MKSSEVVACVAIVIVGVGLTTLWTSEPAPPPSAAPVPGSALLVEADRPPIPDPLAYDGPRLLGVEGWRADLELLRTAIPRHFSYVEHRAALCGVDVDALVDAGLAALADDATPRDFVAALKRVIAGLHDGHAFATVDGIPYQQAWRWPVHLMDSAEGVFVLGVTPGLKTAGTILPGDLVTAVDGVPVDELIAEQQLQTFASSDDARRVWALHHLPRSWDAARVEFSLVREGTPRDVTVDCVPHDTIVGAPMRLYAEEAFDPGIAPGVAWWRPGKFSPTADHNDFMALDQAGREAFTEAKRAGYGERAATLADHRAVIIDLRGNPGGTDMLGQAFASQFVPPESVYFKLQGRDENGHWYRVSEHTVPALDGREPYDGQIVLIVDERTFSTADNVAACLVDTRDDVTVVGRHAGSGTGAPRTFTLPHSGASVTFCTMLVWTAADRMTEGQGVVPDIPVTWTIADWLDERRDPDLAAALAAVR